MNVMFGLIVVMALNGQIVNHFYVMNSIEECRAQRQAVIESSRQVLESYCVAVIAESGKKTEPTKK